VPYEIRKAGNQFCVYKKGATKKFGCHPNSAKAKAQLRALYAQEQANGEGAITSVVQEQFEALEAVWSDNAEGLPQADVVIIRPGESMNRRTYSREAIADAVARDFWGGTPMFVDHGDPRMPRKRSFNDLKARIEKGSSYIGAAGEARARTTFIDRDFAEKVRNAGEGAGLSAVHEFQGQRFRGNDGHNHERVDRFLVNHSVDFVAFPAAGGGIAQFLPAQESEDDVDYNSPLLTLDALKQHRPDLIEALAAETDEGGDDDDEEKKDEVPFPAPVPQPEPEPPAPPEGFVTLAQAKAFAEESADRRIAAFVEGEERKADARAAVTAHVAKSGLPERTRNRVLLAFEGQQEYDRKAVQEAIESAAEELKETGWHGPRVIGLGDSTARDDDDKGADAKTRKALYPAMTAFEEQIAFRPGRKVAQEADAGKAN
jgi:hypothetical protein